MWKASRLTFTFYAKERDCWVVCIWTESGKPKLFSVLHDSTALCKAMVLAVSPRTLEKANLHFSFSAWTTRHFISQGYISQNQSSYFTKPIWLCVEAGLSHFSPRGLFDFQEDDTVKLGPVKPWYKLGDFRDNYSRYYWGSSNKVGQGVLLPWLYQEGLAMGLRWAIIVR